MEILEKDHQRTTKMITALEYTAYKKRLREVELFHVKNRISGGILQMFLNTLWKFVKKMETYSCQWCPVKGQEERGTH